jgi:hypothetical protein
MGVIPGSQAGFRKGRGTMDNVYIYPGSFNKESIQEESMRHRKRNKREDSGLVVSEKVWSLAFADDLIIVAKSEREMKEMMKSLGN